MSEQGRKLTAAEAVSTFGEGAFNKETVSLTFETLDGERHLFGFRQSDIPALITQLIQLAQRGAQLAGTLHRPMPGDRMNATAIDAIALGAIPGRQSGEAFLAVHTGAFPIAFSVPTKEFEALQTEVAELGILSSRQ